MSNDGFVHLHTHSEYSLLDGAARVSAPSSNPDAPTIFTAAVEAGMGAVGLTDHGVMFGALRFYEAARSAGVKPIIGVEAYVALGSRFDRNPGESGEKYHHLTLLAENETGYRNLLKLVSAAHLEGFYHRPRMDKQLMSEHSEGVICLSGCLSSEFGKALQDSQMERARHVAAEYRDIFGKDNYFVELQDHGLADQKAILPGQISIARELGIPTVATNDLHYVRKQDAKPHDVLLCIQQSKLQADTKRLKFDAEDFYLKTAQEMRYTFSEVPESCDNTLLIAERADLELKYGENAPAEERYHLPKFETPGGIPAEEYLRQLVDDGSKHRYGEPVPAEVRERIDRELSVINQMGFATYFLVVWDLIRFARESGIRVGPGRGSAAGSVVSYCLRITDLDPLRYNLLFERFLNPDRLQMPDIDMDFEERRRDEVIKYATNKYGSDHVAQIVTFQTIKGKQGIRDAARVLGFPPYTGDRLCKMYPPVIMGRDEPLDKALKISTELKDAYEKEPDARDIIDTARALEGLRREDSVHAAGVVIGDAPLVNYLPLKLAKDSRDDSKRVVTQFDMHDVEELGLLKMDFLGLRNLSVIEDTLSHLRRRGIEIDIDAVALDDEPTFEMLRRADTTGVFQMESPGMRQLIKLLQPDRFEDLMALVALYRPGLLAMGQHTEYAERKHGRRKVEYPHPALEEVLKDTYGIIVYQEQVMQVAVTMAGYTMGQADTLRKVMGKKKRELLPPHRDMFKKGAEGCGYKAQMAEDLFELIVPFADYGFNASHACAYGFVAYQTAYLKCHYPVEYMAAILTSVKEDKDRKPFYLNACRTMDLEVLPPDVNDSEMDFAPASSGHGEADCIRFGLSAVRNIGEGVVEQILKARAEKGAFTSFSDFCRKVEPSAIGKRVIESLALAGAFDSLGYSRRGIMHNHEVVSAPILSERKAEAAGQFSLFGGQEGETQQDQNDDESVLKIPEFERSELLSHEKNALGQYVSDHPLLEVKDALAALCTHDLSELDSESVGDGEFMTVGGIVGAVARKFTKKGDAYAQFRLEGLAGGIEVIAFPSVFEAAPDLIVSDRIVLVKGRADLRGREMQIRATEITAPDLGRETAFTAKKELVVDLSVAACTSAVLSRLRELFIHHPGSSEVRVRMIVTEGPKPFDIGLYKVDTNSELLTEVQRLLGPAAARIESVVATPVPV